MKISKKLLNIIIPVLLYIVVISFPFDLFIKNELWLNLSNLLLRVVYLIFVFIYIKKEGLFAKRTGNCKDFILFAPFFIATFSNFIYLIFNKSAFNSLGYSNFNFIIVFNIFLLALIEEIVFRMLIQNNLPIKNKFLKILVAAGIFGAFHLLNLINGFNLLIFVQMIYTFALGMVVGLIYEYTYSLLYVFIYHFAFNLLNSYLFGLVAENSWDISFVITNIVIAVVLGLYWLFLFIRFQKEEVKALE